MVANILIWLVVDLFMLITFIYLPITRGEDAFFGSRVSLETYQGSGRRLLQRYWFWLVMTFLEIELLGLLVSYYRWQLPLARLSTMVVFVPAGFLLYSVFARQAKPLAIVEESQRFASSLKVRRFSDYTNIVLEAVNLVLVVAPMLLLVYYYPSLPERIPTHWNWQGVPDSWAAKSFTTVFILPLTVLYLQGLMLLMKQGMLETKMTLPVQHTEAYLSGKEESLSTTIWLLDWIRLLESSLMGGISINLTLGAIGRPEFVPMVTAIIVTATVMIFGVCGYAVYRIYQIDRRLKAQVGRVYVQRKTDAACWYGGGIFYYNPDDPAIFVEKLVGLGYTLNFGNRRVYLYLAYIALLPLYSLCFGKF